MQLIDFFLAVRQEKVPATVSEFLDLLEGLKYNLAVANLDDLYCLSRACLVKSESHFDKFDKAFDKFFSQFANSDRVLDHVLLDPDTIETLLQNAQVDMSDRNAVFAKIEEFIEQLQQASLQNRQPSDQDEGNGSQAQGSGKGQGSEGTSSGGGGGNASSKTAKKSDAVKLKKPKAWKKREYKALDDNEILSTRNIQVALRGLRKYAREGAEEELDLSHTISATANNAGYLDIKMRPERHNKVKVLLLLDVGGSMDPYVRECEALFRAAKSEFKYLKTYYFHNFIYQQLWEGPYRLGTESVDTEMILHKYNSDYKVIFVGDARMADYEIKQQFGCVEFANNEPGEAWMAKFMDTFKKVVWLNPLPKQQWRMGNSIKITRELVDDHMYPMSIRGLDKAMKYLN